MDLDVIICPGCGWKGNKRELNKGPLDKGSCPVCEFQNGLPPYTMLTVSEMLTDEYGTEYTDVRMDLFLATLLEHIFPGKKFGLDNPPPVRSNVL